jgi:hypothetical protein
MTYDEFKRHLGKAGLSIKEFAELVKMHPAAVANYGTSGHVSKWLAVSAALMGEMADKGVDFRAVLSRIAISPAAPRGPEGEAFGRRVVTAECPDVKESKDDRPV